MNFHTETFGRTPEGEEVFLYTLTSAKGLRARIMNYGATIVSMEVPDRHGKLDDVLLGHDDFDGYIDPRGLCGGGHRPVRQSHRQRQIRPGRRRVQAGRQQRAQPHPRRPQEFRRHGLEAGGSDAPPRTKPG